MSHRNARLTVFGRRLLVERVRSGRPVAHARPGGAGRDGPGCGARSRRAGPGRARSGRGRVCGPAAGRRPGPPGRPGCGAASYGAGWSGRAARPRLPSATGGDVAAGASRRRPAASRCCRPCGGRPAHGGDRRVRGPMRELMVQWRGLFTVRHQTAAPPGMPMWPGRRGSRSVPAAEASVRGGRRCPSPRWAALVLSGDGPPLLRMGRQEGIEGALERFLDQTVCDGYLLPLEVMSRWASARPTSASCGRSDCRGADGGNEKGPSDAISGLPHASFSLLGNRATWTRLRHPCVTIPFPSMPRTPGGSLPKR